MDDGECDHGHQGSPQGRARIGILDILGLRVCSLGSSLLSQPEGQLFYSIIKSLQLHYHYKLQDTMSPFIVLPLRIQAALVILMLTSLEPCNAQGNSTAMSPSPSLSLPQPQPQPPSNQTQGGSSNNDDEKRRRDTTIVVFTVGLLVAFPFLYIVAVSSSFSSSSCVWPA